MIVFYTHTGIRENGLLICLLKNKIKVFNFKKGKIWSRISKVIYIYRRTSFWPLAPPVIFFFFSSISSSFFFLVFLFLAHQKAAALGRRT